MCPYSTYNLEYSPSLHFLLPSVYPPPLFSFALTASSALSALPVVILPPHCSPCALFPIFFSSSLPPTLSHTRANSNGCHTRLEPHRNIHKALTTTTVASMTTNTNINLPTGLLQLHSSLSSKAPISSYVIVNVQEGSPGWVWVGRTNTIEVDQGKLPHFSRACTQFRSRSDEPVEKRLRAQIPPH